MNTFWQITILIHFTGATISWLSTRKEMHDEASWIIKESVIDSIALLYWLIAWEYVCIKNVLYFIEEKYLMWKVIRILKKNNLWYLVKKING